MEEEKKKKENFWTWIKENPWTAATEVTLFTLSIVEGVMLFKQVGNLKKENQSLKSENADLRGQVHATEKENRRLGREIGNLNYQLGKSVASKNK